MTGQDEDGTTGGTDSPPPAADAVPRSRRRRVLKAVGLTVLVLALVVGIGGFLALRQLDGNITSNDVRDQLSNRPERGYEGPDGPLNILVLGSDARDGEGNDIDGLTGEGARADTTILLHVSEDREDVYGVSLPRDAVIDRPDCVDDDGNDVPGEEDQLFNTAYAVAGPGCVQQTVEQLTGIYIDHYVVVDFDGFGDMVEAVGGVEVCVPVEVADEDKQIFLDAGTQTLDRDQALDYVRERYVLSPNSDIGRMKRQQAFVASLINKVSSRDILARPDKLFRFLDAATSSLTTDPGFASTRTLVGLGLQLDGTGLSDIQFTTVPIVEYPLDANLLEWAPEAEGLWREIRRDQPLGPEYSGDAISAEAPVPGGSGGSGGAGGGGGNGGGGSGGGGGDAGPSPEEFGLCG
ncbi:LCP family protein [uncultured Nocardioides sp.]|uniref:LCP family protein n=1 Tax=uncultured Nocardioides sp. TaxID=198441 RepID=UPI002623CD94|nr:LCP family protein [uncultured Nocardioides sp.]